jgi:hypothetical protein
MQRLILLYALLARAGEYDPTGIQSAGQNVPPEGGIPETREMREQEERKNEEMLRMQEESKRQPQEEEAS